MTHHDTDDMHLKVIDEGGTPHIAQHFEAPRDNTPIPCCGDPKNLDGGAHPWEHISEDGPGDVYRCPECGATDVD
jgi:hypothetical protein